MEFPKAKDAFFLNPLKPFLEVYPSGCLPIWQINGKRAVLKAGKEYLLGVTPKGFFALFPPDCTAETPASYVIVRSEGVDNVFTDPESLTCFLFPPVYREPTYNYQTGRFEA